MKQAKPKNKKTSQRRLAHQQQQLLEKKMRQFRISTDSVFID